ncbi:DUF4255 domain-containing protein, partial [Balneolaceae bacterium ANBcel3]|nr:DUF4255 domain-containing protein [Balneolaceae bacterium ANBcel3]
IQGRLSEYIKLRTDTQESRVEVNAVLKQDGSVAISNNHIGISLVNVEEEKHGKDPARPASQLDGRFTQSNPEVNLYSYLLFSAHFSDYKESLKALSHVIMFFQGRHVFERTRFASLEAPVERLVFELQSLSLEQLNHLWGTIGGKYMPSVVYKMKMLVFNDGQPLQTSHPVKEINIHASGVMK